MNRLRRSVTSSSNGSLRIHAPFQGDRRISGGIENMGFESGHSADVESLSTNSGFEEGERNGFGPQNIGSPLTGNVDVLTLVDVLEQEYAENRDKMIDERYVLRTPLKVVKDLVDEYSADIEILSFEIHKPSTYIGPERITQRVRMNIQEFSGDGQAPRYRLALQLAAADMLEKMKSEQEDFTVDPYGMLPGCRINPWVYKDLRGACQMQGLPLPTYKQIQSRDCLFFAYKCCVGNIFEIGSSDSIYLAKRMCAKRMYERLLGEPYPDDDVAVGLGCLQYEDLQAMGINPIKWESTKSSEFSGSTNGLTLPNRREDGDMSYNFGEEEDDIEIQYDDDDDDGNSAIDD